MAKSVHKIVPNIKNVLIRQAYTCLTLVSRTRVWT